MPKKMQTEYSGDPVFDVDQPVYEAVKERKGRPIRIRLQPQILRTREGEGYTTSSAYYQFWKEVRWTIECGTPKEVFQLRDALRAFFKALGRGGVKATMAALDTVPEEEAA